MNNQENIKNTIRLILTRLPNPTLSVLFLFFSSFILSFCLMTKGTKCVIFVFLVISIIIYFILRSEHAYFNGELCCNALSLYYLSVFFISKNGPQT